MKYLFLSLICSIGFSAMAQNAKFFPPNYSEIEKNIKKRDSNLYYPKLMERFKNGDSTFTLDEKHHLYYGFIFQPQYSPYNLSTIQREINKINEKDSISTDDWKELQKSASVILDKNPFDIGTIEYFLIASENLNDLNSLQKGISQLRTVYDAIINSGDGLTKESSFYVIKVSNEYDVLRALELKMVSQSLIKPYDYLKVAENELQIEELYFDISPSLNHMAKLFGSPEKNKKKKKDKKTKGKNRNIYEKIFN
jgi:hypothetical protein